VEESNLKAPCKREQARSRILSTALSRFASRGYDGVSTTEIAKAAGVTQPLIHYHFKSKEALWQAAVQRVFGWLQEELVSTWADEDFIHLPAEKRAEQELRAFLKGLFSFMARHPEFGQLIMRECTEQSERLEWLVNEWIQPELSRLIQRHQFGVDNGVMRDIPFSHIATVVTAAATLFFSMRPLIESAYGVNSLDPDQAATYTATVSDMICSLVFVSANSASSNLASVEAI